ncbi:hypothetical protein ACWDTT_15820 [Streptosporangium sandarakinum]
MTPEEAQRVLLRARVSWAFERALIGSEAAFFIGGVAGAADSFTQGAVQDGLVCSVVALAMVACVRIQVRADEKGRVGR